METWEHLETIDEAIHALYQRIGPVGMERFQAVFEIQDYLKPLRENPIIATQHLVKAIAEKFGLRIGTVIVTFASHLDHPGHVELSDSNDFFIEIAKEHECRGQVIAAILAHEVAHIFLHKLGLRFQSTLANEVLTDTAAAYLGFGSTIMNAAASHTSVTEPYERTSTEHFGYISLPEFGYVVAKRDRAFGTSSDAFVESVAAKESLRVGAMREETSWNIRPLVPRPVHERIFRLVTKRKKIEAIVRSLTFTCPCCSQSLRVPETHRELMIRCPVCRSEYRCYS